MNDISELQKVLEDDLLKLHGPILFGESLLKALGYPTKAAFRQSLLRDTVPVPLFRMEKRRGYYALAKDVAKYLAERRYSGLQKTSKEDSDM